ncbi:hypothetical protein [Burkholderia sp. 22PA0106]|uniref:hypothetical protein n=1 Tax=Burkholderia sp. 22PA0106 TaxID=3237371 RepID=UPI0039C3D0D7
MKQTRTYAAAMRRPLLRQWPLLVFAVVTMPFAHAQSVSGQVSTAPALDTPAIVDALSLAGKASTSAGQGPSATFSSATITGGTIRGTSIDIGSTLKSNGMNVMRVGPASVYNAALFVGPNAGAHYPIDNPWALGIGAYAANALNQSQAEVVCIGALSCLRLVDGNYNAVVGLHAAGADPHANDVAVLGNDAARNEIGGGAFTAVGSNAGRNGTTDMTVAEGAGALRGNAVSITFGGVATVGDTITVQLTCTASGVCANSPKSWPYTVKAGDTLTSISQAFVALMNAAPVSEVGNLVVLQARSPQVTSDPIVSLDFTGSVHNGWKARVTVAMSAGATETARVGTGTNASSVIAIGPFAVDGAAIQHYTNSVFVGGSIAPRLINGTETSSIGHWASFSLQNGSGQTNVGEQSLFSNVSGNYNTAFGVFSGYGTIGQYNSFFGPYAGWGVTTGNGNFIGGEYATSTPARSCITTGSWNTEIGSGACVANPRADGQLSIQNAITGTGNLGRGLAMSTGFIGIYQPSPIAALDVKAHSTSGSDLAFRVNDSTDKTLFSVNSAGNVMQASLGAADATGRSADIGSETIFTARRTGIYCLSAFSNVTMAATTSSTLPAVTLNWVGGDTHASQSYTTEPSTGNSQGTYSQGQVCAYIAGGTAVTYSTNGYASSGKTAMQYAAHIRAYFGGN